MESGGDAVKMSYMSVVSRIFKCLPKFQLPGVYTLHNPLPLSTGWTCKYDGIVAALLGYGYMTVIADLKGLKSRGCSPGILEESKYPCCEKAYRAQRNCSWPPVAESGPWSMASKKKGHQSYKQQETKFPKMSWEDFQLQVRIAAWPGETLSWGPS